MTIQLRWRRIAAVTSTTALLGLTLSGFGVASADQFVTENSAPTVSSPSLSATISPDSGASDAVYSYAITVGDADTLNDLDTVTVCLYQTEFGDATCATPDPTTDVTMTWSQSTDAFTIEDGSVNDYWALGTVDDVSVSPTLTGTSGIFTFNFTVSEATREGGWTAVVTATDSSATTATNNAAIATVNHYSAITTRASQDFGQLGAGLANGVERTASPTVTANGQTTYSMAAGDFTDGTYTFSLKTDGATSVEPAAAEVTLDCEVASSFTEASAVRVGSTSTELSATQTATGAPEDGSAIDNTCRLAHGGQLPVGTYSITVVNTVGNG